jgi:hypothetical protein
MKILVLYFKALTIKKVFKFSRFLGFLLRFEFQVFRLKNRIHEYLIFFICL